MQVYREKMHLHNFGSESLFIMHSAGVDANVQQGLEWDAN